MKERKKERKRGPGREEGAQPTKCLPGHGIPAWDLLERRETGRLRGSGAAARSDRRTVGETELLQPGLGVELGAGQQSSATAVRLLLCSPLLHTPPPAHRSVPNSSY